MPYYKICSRCGAHLDPGEACDCEGEKKKQEEFFEENLQVVPETGQLVFCLEDESK